MDLEIERFLSYMAVERGVSRNTLSAYRSDARQLHDFLRESAGEDAAAIDWRSVGSQEVAAYLLHLRGKEYSDTTLARKVASTRSFFGFLFHEGIIDEDPTDKMSAPKVGRSLPKALSVEEVDALLDGPADPSPEARRDRAMLEVLYASGIRVSELVSLDTDDVDLEQGFVRCFGKGSKERLVPIHPGAAKVLGDYIEHGRPQLYSKRSDRALFLNRRGRASRGRDSGSYSRARRPGQASRRASARTRCATALLLTCFGEAPRCGTCRSCWATPASRPRRSTLTSPASTSGPNTRSRTPAPDPHPAPSSQSLRWTASLPTLAAIAPRSTRTTEGPSCAAKRHGFQPAGICRPGNAAHLCTFQTGRIDSA